MSKRAWGQAVQNREEIFDLKRTAVINTAAALIKARGYENVSLADIADELHIAKPTLYHYFKSKGELLRELFAIAIQSFLSAAEHPEDYPLVQGLNGAMQLERFIRRAARIVTDDVGSSLVTLPSAGQTLSAMQPHSHDVRRMAETILRAGMDDGSLAPGDTETTYNFIIGALRHLPFWFAGAQRPLDEVSDALVRLVLSGIAARAR